MKYFVPELVLGPLAPAQTQLTEKFGGLPWGLPLSRWPFCRECGNPQTHLVTLVHSADRLDLGAEGRAVLVFQCGHSPNETDCQTYAIDSGANAVVFLDTQELGSGLTEPPVPGTPREIEMRVTGWVEQNDLITEELEPLLYRAEGFWEFQDAHEDAINSIADGAKIGGSPGWIQWPESVAPGFHFAAQLGYSYHFPGPLPTAEAVKANISQWIDGVRVLEKPLAPDPNLRGKLYINDITLGRYGSGFDVDAADFGDGGDGYIFILPDPVAPQGLLCWQCG